MIAKSYEISKKPSFYFKYNLFLLYGENEGLKKEIKFLIAKNKQDAELLSFYENNIISDKEKFYNTIYSASLFTKEKIIIINGASDKIFNEIEEISEKFPVGVCMIIISNILDKKSKLRNFFEKSNECGIVACYQDNEINIKNIILRELKDYKEVKPADVSLIIDNCGLDRVKLYNELDKIKIYFQDKKVNRDELEILLNLKIIDDFNNLRDEALKGDKLKTNKLLNETDIEPDKFNFYLNSINQRLIKIYKVKNAMKSRNLDEIIENIKPPIFWKDKPIFIAQARKWDMNRLKKLIHKSHNIELNLKSGSSANKTVLIKNLLVEICSLANS